MPHANSSTTNLSSTGSAITGLPVAELPADGSLAYGNGRFFRLDIPKPPYLRVRLVEIPLSHRPTPPKVLSVDPAKLCLAIARGVVTILPKHQPKPAAPRSRPYPFEAAPDAARKRRQLWRRPEVVRLRRRGLLMTGAEYERLRACGASTVLPSDTDRGDD